jgi:hypothetical protein
MAQLFVDSFGIYSTADIPTRWPGGGANGYTIVNTPLPPGSQAGAQVLAIGNNFQGITTNNFGANPRVITGFRFMKATGTSATQGIIIAYGHQLSMGQFRGVCSVQYDAMGTYITDGVGAVLGTGPIVPFNEWHHYEFDAQMGLAGAATLKLYLDGSPTPFISVTGASTQYAEAEFVSTGSGPINGVFWNVNAGGGYYADFYMFNGTGAAPFNAALAPQSLGAAKMAFAIPNGAGTVSAWTPNGAATIWQCINQIPQDGDTTYASDATPGDQYQCTFTALPLMQTLISVQLSTYARTDDAGPRAYQSGFWHAGTFGYSGMNQFLGGTYNYIQDEFMTNPVTGLAWAPADLTGLQFGAKLTI